MDFEKVLTFLLENFKKQSVRYAIMGGFALHAAGYTRTTEDVDILIHKEDIQKIKKFLLGIGYELIHESADVVQFKGSLIEMGQIDFLLAHRSYTEKMLKRAKEYAILNAQFQMKVLIPEDVIGLKVQAMANDPKRIHRELADIDELFKRHFEQLDLNLLREYFTLFEHEKELNALIQKYNQP